MLKALKNLLKEDIIKEENFVEKGGDKYGLGEIFSKRK